MSAHKRTRGAREVTRPNEKDLAVAAAQVFGTQTKNSRGNPSPVGLANQEVYSRPVEGTRSLTLIRQRNPAPNAHEQPHMSSRDLAAVAGKRHGHVLRDVEHMFQELGQTSAQIWVHVPDTYGRRQRVALLTKRETLILASGYDLLMRAKIIDRWLELEQATAPSPAAMLNDPNVLRTLLLGSSEREIGLQAQVAQLSPKADALDRIATATSGSVCIRDSRKALGLNMIERHYFARLHQEKLIFRQVEEGGDSGWRAYADPLRQGLLEHKTVTGNKPDGGVWTRVQVLVTPKGLTKLARLFGNGLAVTPQGLLL